MALDLTVRPSDRYIRIAAALVAATGLAATGVAVFADELGVGASPGTFGSRRVSLLVVGGIAIAVGAVLFARPRIAARLFAIGGLRSLGLWLTADRRRASTVAWRAFWTSRLLVWSAGIFGVLVWTVVGADAHGTFHTGSPSDTLSGVLLSPALQWDAGWFVSIADQGYEARAPDSTAFFPLYPLLIRVVGTPIEAAGVEGARSFELAGVLVSLTAFVVALFLLHRLTDLELGGRAADNAVALLALFPTSVYFSAIYTESLFLALTIGCVYSARRGWWWRAAALGALATATRSQGVLLLLPLAIMLCYGPRGDRRPVPAQRRTLRPGFRPLPREAAALLLVPVGLLGYIGYVWATTEHGALTPFQVQETVWLREFKGPFVALWDGPRDAADAVRELVGGAYLLEQFSFVRGSLLNFAALAFAGIGLAGALRRLPIAYGAYALAALIVAISFPHPTNPLYSLPRFVLVLFPIFMWAGLAMTRSALARNLVLVASAAGLACLSVLFALGYWIA